MKIKKPHLTTHQRIALTFSFYTLLLVALIYLLIYFLFRFTITIQLKNQLLTHSANIISTHLKPTTNSYTFILDAQNRTLKEYLLRNQLSAVFLDSHLNITRKYGSFILPAQPTHLDTSHLLQLIKSLPQLTFPHFQFLEWQEQAFFTLTAPIRNDTSQTLGYLILAQPLGQYQLIQKTLTLSFITLSFISLLGSFLLGKIATHKALSPLENLLTTIQNLDLDTLDAQLQHSGHPQDLLSQLINQFNHMLTQIKDMSNRQKEFISNASHELKTPLARLLSSLELIELNAHTPQTITQLKQELLNINQLIDQLLLLATITTPHSLKPHSLPLQNIVQKTIDSYQSQIRTHHVHIKLNHIPTTTSSVLTTTYLTIILDNLFSNALKYSPPNTTITLIYHSSSHSLSLTNTTQNISSSHLRQLTHRFFRGPNATHTSGYGIGLSIVQRILQTHQLAWHINQPSPSTFTFTFTLLPSSTV